MRLQKRHAIMLPAIVLASCSFGPRLETSMPQVRNIPVLANLSPADSFARARSFLAAKQYGLAIELYKAASRDRSLAVESLNGLAIAYDGIGRRDLAERYFQRALALRPGDERSKRNLAAYYSTSGQVAKRRQLLADAGPRAPDSAERQEVRLVADAADPSAAPIVLAVALDTRSPLGSTFRPLMVQATLATTPVRGSAAPAAVEATIMCVPRGDDSRAALDRSAVQVFRISIGEIFIMTRPRGASCAIQDGVSADVPGAVGTSTSNREYLGLVAEYLDRINNEVVPMADISHLWRAAFWPQSGDV